MYSLYTRFRVAIEICKHYNINFDSQTASVPLTLRGRSFELTPSRIIFWTGRTMGTLSNHKALLMRVVHLHAQLSSKVNSDEGLNDRESENFQHLEMLCTPVQTAVIIPIPERAACLTWSFPQLATFIDAATRST